MTEYQALPSETSIRILKIEPTRPNTPLTSQINCSVQIIDLNDEGLPPYTCLSYTWGSPFPSFAPETVRYHSERTSDAPKPTILIDGKEMVVTQSLYEALFHLRQAESKRLQSIWIDAICIDQRIPEGTAERGIQVSMMDRIYATAEHVLVWLGPAAEDDARSIVSTIRSLGGVTSNTLELAWIDSPLDILHADTYSRLKLPLVSREKWKLLRNFYERTWFQRMWVTQEAGLAHSISLHLGSQKMTWEELDKATWVIYRIDGFFRDIYAPPPGIVERLLKPDEALRTTELTSLAWNSIQSISSFREQLKHQDVKQRFIRREVNKHFEGLVVTREYAGNPQAWKAFRTHTLHKSRRKMASDPRDKIYAMLGLLQGMTDETGRKNIDPDYSNENTATQLYTSVIRRFFQEAPGVVWGAAIRVPPIEDRSMRRIRDLPSWVPDLSAPDLPLHIMSASMFHFNASAHLRGGLVHQKNPFKWGLRGLSVDKIAELGEDYEELKSTFNLKRTLELIPKLKLSAGLECGEVLARTMIASQNLGFQVPKEEFQLIFRSYLIVLKATKLSHNADATNPQNWEVNRADLSDLDVLEDGWRLGFGDISEVLRYLLYPNKSSPSIQLTLELAARYEEKLNRIFSCRRLFLTQQGRLGIGPRSMKAHDEIWVIPPEKTFHILRPLVRPEYELMGDAYIDGIMFGEAARSTTDDDLAEILLV